MCVIANRKETSTYAPIWNGPVENLLEHDMHKYIYGENDLNEMGEQNTSEDN